MPGRTQAPQPGEPAPRGGNLGPQPLREVAFDEIFDSQRTFRVLLDALSRPGRIFRLRGLDYRGVPPGMTPHCLTILKTLCDHQVSFAVASGPSSDAWREYLEVNLAAPAGAAAESGYVLFEGGSFCLEFLALRRGSLEFPEEGATAILAVEDVLADEAGQRSTVRDQEEPSCRLRLGGPGVNGTVEVGFHGLDPRYPEALGTINEFFPLGVDCLFVDPGGRVAGVPRSSSVEML